MMPAREQAPLAAAASTAPAGPTASDVAINHPRLPVAPHFAVAEAGTFDSTTELPSRLPRATVARQIPPRFVAGCIAVFTWEIKTLLSRPTTYVLLLAAALLAGWSFSWLMTLLSHGANAALRPADDPVAQFLGPNVFLIGGCTLLIPLLTMNTIADERRRSSWEILLTAPVSPFAVVLGKFAASWSLFMACLMPWFYYLVVLGNWNGRVKFLWNVVPWSAGPGLALDWGPMCSGALGLAVVGATFVALGLFCSGLSRGPASAALLSLVAMGAILCVGFVPRVLEYWSFPAAQIALVESLSCWAHIDRFSRGIVEPPIVVAHLSICASLLWGTAYLSRKVDQS